MWDPWLSFGKLLQHVVERHFWSYELKRVKNSKMCFREWSTVVIVRNNDAQMQMRVLFGSRRRWAGNFAWAHSFVGGAHETRCLSEPRRRPKPISRYERAHRQVWAVRAHRRVWDVRAHRRVWDVRAHRGVWVVRHRTVGVWNSRVNRLRFLCHAASFFENCLKEACWSCINCSEPHSLLEESQNCVFTFRIIKMCHG